MFAKIIIIIFQKTIVWDCNSRRAIQEFKFHSDCVNDICWISSNAYASGSSDGFVFVSEVGQSTPVEAFYQGVCFFKVSLIIRKMIFNPLEFKDCVWRVIWNRQDRELIAGSSRSLKVCFASQTEKMYCKVINELLLIFRFINAGNNNILCSF